MSRAAAALALAVSACAAAPEIVHQPAHEPDRAGLAIVGSPLRIDFGRAEAGTVSAVSRLEGGAPAEVATCRDGVRAVRWRSGLSLQFRDGAFLGWSRPDGSSSGLACEV